jgi:ribosomal protein S18 acetylase RimI-like enzyme
LIAAATAADLPELAGLMAASDLLRRYRVSLNAALASLSSAFDAGDILLVSRTADHLAGFAWLSSASHVLNGAAYLRLLLVAEDKRNARTGSELLAAAEARARELANHLYLLATTDNTGARRFYERHGYRFVGSLPGLVWPDLDEALYYKTLRAYEERLS